MILLDGGIGHLLKSKGLDSFSETLAYDELFAAGSLANILRPDIVRKVHQDYSHLCNVITTNTFGCTKFSLGKIDRADQAIELAVAAAKLAKEVANTSGRRVLVAGSLPPLQESYQIYTLQNTTNEQREHFQEEYIQLATAMAPHIDLFLFETISSVTEALIAARAACTVHKLYPTKPWWISFSLEDSERAVLRSGEPLELAAQQVFEKFPENSVEAILLNCCAPAAITAGLKALRPITLDNKVKIGGYANGFKTTTSEWLSTSGFKDVNMPATATTTTSSSSVQSGENSAAFLALPPELYDAEGIILPEAYLKHVENWVSEECGAEIVGGCCGIGPEHIALLAATLR